ncbi:cytochrome oxidase putative small subunit CydP [Rhodanobacter koreensis]
MSGSAASSAPTENASVAPRPLRRLTLELFGVIILKITLLMLIWWVAFAPQPKPDTSPDAIAHRLSPSSSQPPSAGHP